jgi:hypothetical protein
MTPDIKDEVPNNPLLAGQELLRRIEEVERYAVAILKKHSAPIFARGFASAVHYLAQAGNVFRRDS